MTIIYIIVIDNNNETFHIIVRSINDGTNNNEWQPTLFWSLKALLMRKYTINDNIFNRLKPFF